MASLLILLWTTTRTGMLPNVQTRNFSKELKNLKKNWITCSPSRQHLKTEQQAETFPQWPRVTFKSRPICPLSSKMRLVPQSKTCKDALKPWPRARGSKGSEASIFHLNFKSSKASFLPQNKEQLWGTHLQVVNNLLFKTQTLVAKLICQLSLTTRALARLKQRKPEQLHPWNSTEIQFSPQIAKLIIISNNRTNGSNNNNRQINHSSMRHKMTQSS